MGIPGINESFLTRIYHICRRCPFLAIQKRKVRTLLAYLGGGHALRTKTAGVEWKLDVCHKNVTPLLNEDRISSLPDELILEILSCMDAKLAVQTSLLSPRWKLLWTSMPCLNFYSRSFDSSLKFGNFVSNFLSSRNHQVDVSSVKLDFHEVGSQVILAEIVNYAFFHNVQNLLVIVSKRLLLREVPPCLLSSKSLETLTFSIPCRAPTTPWDFPAITTMHLETVQFYDNPVDLFSKCVNLKNLTLEKFAVFVEVFVISIPQLSNLRLINGKNSIIVNVVAPQLENLTIRNCSIKKLNAPQGLTSLCYEDYHPPQLPKDCFNSLNKASVNFHLSRITKPYKEIDARETIDMLQELHSVKCLTLNLDIVECLSSFPEILSQHPSPFRNMISVNIDSSRKEPYKVKISTETKNFLLENSPRATLIMDLPEEPPTKAMIAKQARQKKMAKQIADVESQMNELQLLLDQENKLAERIESKENKVPVKNLVAELLGWRKRIMQSAPERAQIDEVVAGLLVQIKAHMGEIQDLIKQENHYVVTINSKKLQVSSLLENLPKPQRADIIARYSHQLRQTETLCFRLLSGTLISDETNAFIKYVSDNLSIFQDDSSSKPPLAS